MFLRVWCFFEIFLFLVDTSVSLKILGLFPHPGKSHVDVFIPIMKGLAKKGHEVTVISYFEYPNHPPIESYRELVIDLPNEKLINVIDLSWLKGYFYEKHLATLQLAYSGGNNCRNGLNSSVVQNLYKSTNESFDLIIMEMFNSDCFVPFAYKFDAPIIGLSSCTIMPWTHSRFANPTHTAYIPSTTLTYSDEMSFYERVVNTVSLFFQNTFYNFFIRNLDDYFARKYLDEKLPWINDIIYNYTELLLVNTHFTLNLAKPQVPSIIEIGGVHIEEPKKLSKNLEKWINDSSPHGVIYFSLGSMIKGHTFPEEKRQVFLRAFARLPHRVLWKWENETMPEKPDNLMIQKWMPQLDILCNPNVKAFISHGGLLGTTEAVHCGVPMVVMPQYGDQFTNARALEKNGGGVILNFREANEDDVYNALKTILDPEFQKNAKELSVRFKDRPLPPLETAIYWVEYVARHRGAHHMRTAAVGMPYYQYFLLDVIAFLLVVSTTTLFILYRFSRMVIKALCVRKSKKIKIN